MLEITEETVFFDIIKPELLATHAGRFAVICGRRLIGVYDSVADSLGAMAEAFAEFNLPDGMPILITEIAETVSVRVMARPSRPAREGLEAAR